MGHLVLVRHGESRWNQCNRFTGWVDVPLSEAGIEEAEKCAHQCKKFDFAAAYTSKLERAHSTMNVILAHQNRTGIVQHEHDKKHYKWVAHSNGCGTDDIPVIESTALNERYYGRLQGLEKGEAEKKYGKEKVLAWRRSYDAKPPGGGESLEETFNRVLPFFRKYILPRVRKSDDVLVVAHGNTLRAMIKFIEKISEIDIAFVDLPQAQPIVYEYKRGGFKRISGEYHFNRPLR
jgi:2,3-bisphosphoglycerate-dependent phosphoglycerate mutase